MSVVDFFVRLSARVSVAAFLLRLVAYRTELRYHVNNLLCKLFDADLFRPRRVLF